MVKTRSTFQLILAIDFVAFFMSPKHIFYTVLTMKLQLLRDPYPGSAPGPRRGISVPGPPCYIPQQTDRCLASRSVTLAPGTLQLGLLLLLLNIAQYSLSILG